MAQLKQKQSAFLNSPLVTWTLSLNEENGLERKTIRENLDISNISDERFLSNVWLKIDGSPSFRSKCMSDGDSTGGGRRPSLCQRVERLALLLQDLQDFYDDNEQLVVMKLPNIVKIASMKSCPSDDDLDELRRLLLLLLGSAVQCQRNKVFVEAIKSQLDDEQQVGIMYNIKEITENPCNVWSKMADLGWQDNKQHSLYSTALDVLSKLVRERNSLWKQCVQLILRVEHLTSSSGNGSTGNTEREASLASSLDCSSYLSSLSSVQTASSSQQLSSDCTTVDAGMHGADVNKANSKLKKLHHELQEKDEMISELKDLLDQYKESNDKLRQDNVDLMHDARKAKTLRDEIDILNEKIERTGRLECELEKSRDKMKEIDGLKSQLKEVREENRILGDAKAALEEEVDQGRLKDGRLCQLERQLDEQRVCIVELEAAKDEERKRSLAHLDQLSQLEMDKKALVEQLTDSKGEQEFLQSKLLAHERNLSGQTLLEQLNNDARKRVLELEALRDEDKRKSSQSQEHARRLEADNKSLGEELKVLKINLDKLQSQLSAREREQRQSEEHDKTTAKRMADLESRAKLDERKSTLLEEQVSQLEASKMAAEKQVESLRGDLDKLRLELTSCDQDRKQVWNKLDEAKSKLKEVEKDNERLVAMMKERNNFQRNNSLETRSRSRRPYIDPCLTSVDISDDFSNSASSPDASETDSGYVSVTDELRIACDKLKESECRISSLTRVRTDLEVQVRKYREQVDSETDKLAKSESKCTQLAAECKRLQVQLVNLTKSLEAQAARVSPARPEVVREGKGDGHGSYQSNVTINVINQSTTNEHVQDNHHRQCSSNCEPSSVRQQPAHGPPTYANPNFIRGAFRSASLSYGSHARHGVALSAQTMAPYGTHQHNRADHVHGHYHHFHHHHLHYPTGNALCANQMQANHLNLHTPEEERVYDFAESPPPLASAAVTETQADDGPRSPSGRSDGPAGPNSVWYEYGCV
ncbi:Protein Daple [Halotydeus destructor]|nr:Protein Daple [Halotydeus destructor]